MTGAAAFHVYLYGPDGGPLSSRFEDAAERLAALPRLHFEPDGSLLWCGRDWRICGIIYDRQDVLQYADLQGDCSLERWQAVVQRIAGDTPAVSVLRLADQSLHDLQRFEALTWPRG